LKNHSPCGIVRISRAPIPAQWKGGGWCLRATDSTMKNAVISWQEKLEAVAYVPTREICTVLRLAEALKKPVLVEGPPGAGKTSLARAAADVLGARLIRLQCYEGIDVARAIYEYNYGKQLLYLSALRDRVSQMLDGTKSMAESVRILDREVPFWGDEFLVRRPILEALASAGARVLLIDEVDRSDREFEALLLEVLSEWSISVPEYGTVRAGDDPPLVVLTSNRTRDLSDALRRRCLYIWLDLPDREREARIIQAQVPGAGAAFAAKVAEFIAEYRQLSPRHVPSVAETVELACALLATSGRQITSEDIESAIPVFAKNREDAGLCVSAAERVSRNAAS